MKAAVAVMVAAHLKNPNFGLKSYFFVIVAAAITIAGYKIVAKDAKPEVKAAVVSADSNAKPSCCDTPQPKICTQVKGADNNKPCCPQSKK